MALSGTSNSLIKNNYIYSPGEGLIPGFDPLLLLAIMTGVGVVIIVVAYRKRMYISTKN